MPKTATWQQQGLENLIWVHWDWDYDPLGEKGTYTQSHTMVHSPSAAALGSWASSFYHPFMQKSHIIVDKK